MKKFMVKCQPNVVDGYDIYLFYHIVNKTLTALVLLLG